MERNKNLKKRYTIISKGLPSKFAHDERYRYRGIVFTSKEGAEWFLNNLSYVQQRNMKIVSFIPKAHTKSYVRSH